MIPLTNEYRNDVEIAFYGLRRSGQHAIINWIASMFDGSVYFFNNCVSTDPFRTSSPRGVNKNTPIENIFVDLPKLKHWKEEDLAPIRLTHKNCLMYSFENKNIKKLKKKKFVENRDYVIGKSRVRHDILLFRDLFNWAASLMINREHNPPLGLFPEYNVNNDPRWKKDAMMISGKGYRRAKRYVNFWKFYAQEFLNETDYLKHNKICISFNQWFMDEDYRKKIAKELGLRYSDYALKWMAGIKKGGSSFDEMKFDGRAQEMDILNRWKILKDNIVYNEIVQDIEAIELSRKIFGEIRS